MGLETCEWRRCIISAFDFKRGCTEWSLYDIKVPREQFESIGSMNHLLCYPSHGTLMSYTDHSVQSRLKSNAPINSHGSRPRPTRYFT